MLTVDSGQHTFQRTEKVQISRSDYIACIFCFVFFLNQMLVSVIKTTDSTETTDKAYKSQLWWFLEYSHLL